MTSEEETPPPTQPSSPDPTKNSASLARARASARRRRILQQGKDRMDLVNGETAAATKTTDPPTTETDSSTPNAVVAAAEGETGGGAEENEDKEPEAAPVAAAPVAMTGAQRLAQARRRRYRKTAAAAPAAVVAAAAAPSEEAGGESGAGDANPAGPGDDEEVAAAPVAEDADPVLPTAAAVPSTKTEERKYLGVARMRRKRLAEQKIKEEHQEKEQNALDVKSTKKTGLKLNTGIPALPIFFQLLTVLVLFGAGFDAGVQNHYRGSYQNEAGGGPRVVTSLSLLDNGYGVLSTLGLYHKKTNAASTIIQDVTTTANILMNMEDTQILLEESQDDEFSQTATKPLGASTTTTYEPNIDPLFDIDLDELTRDGTGIIMFLARVAIRFHRFFTYVLYLLPKSFLQGIWSYTPFSSSSTSSAASSTSAASSISTRPIFAICAVLARNIGKHVLGASDAVPDVETVLERRLEAETGAGLSAGEDSVAADGSSSSSGGKKKGDLMSSLGNLDLVATGTNYVKKYAEDNFPKAVVAYRLVQHLKMDMYIILCGFFWGLVLPVGLLGGGFGRGVGGVGEEL